ncbi:5-oxoprolinase subunit PxpB [Paenibacillus apii]|uniref:5-oxoprolinase subunit PxpB n=1 Tax=Paenibacillus apii TaxID=1850370 RepID=UPI00143BF28F|nr:5-oxoprolinase subunit PxpB [Paenibacillus apii]NJJ41943.1 5-oxoprolinase subunit PxpB [Paenibacillus apii]
MASQLISHMDLKYVPLGDQTLVVQFESKISIEINRGVQAFANLINSRKISGIIQTIITFNSLAICYDPVRISFNKLADTIRGLEDQISEDHAIPSKTIHVPVVFGGEYSPDLDEVSARTGLSPEQVIQTIYSKPYYVYMVGFVDGTPYCGDIDERLVLPRRSNPRVKVRKGAVSIAMNQTSLYTIESPGGWHLLGWTPMEIFNPYQERPCALVAGDYLQYVPISAGESERWDDQRQREWDRAWNS